MFWKTQWHWSIKRDREEQTGKSRERKKKEIEKQR